LQNYNSQHTLDDEYIHGTSKKNLIVEIPLSLMRILFPSTSKQKLHLPIRKHDYFTDGGIQPTQLGISPHQQYG
jgi:hypothetical protein